MPRLQAIVSNADAIGVNQAWAGFAGDMLNFSSPGVLPPNVSKSNCEQAFAPPFAPHPRTPSRVPCRASGTCKGPPPVCYLRAACAASLSECAAALI